MDIKDALSAKSAETLADLVIMLLDRLDEKQRIDFIGKYIDAEIVLEALAENGLDADREGIIEQVNGFCVECLGGAYYVEADYDDYFDAYDDEAYKNSKWADRFAEYIRLAVLYARSGDCLAAYDLFIRIFDCIHQCEQDFELLGTDDPITYMDVEVNDVFDVYFYAIQTVKKDIFEAYDKMFAVWSRFERYCGSSFEIPEDCHLSAALPLSAKNDLICKYVSDLTVATDVVIKRIKEADEFSESEKLFLTLEKLFMQKGERFDKLKVSTRLLLDHHNFSYYAALGYYEQGQWENAIQMAGGYLEKTDGKTRKQFEALLTECYEKNGQTRKAYDNALSMFYRYGSFDLYKRTRFLAEKLDAVGAQSFFGFASDYLSKSGDYDAETVYTQILSFEGKVRELSNLANQEAVSLNYDRIKYSAKSLVYRALKYKSGLPLNLSEYITGIANLGLPGITDMLPREDDDLNARDILLSAINILKRQIQFHIDAAKRSRYARAAYYLGIACDIYSYLGEPEKGDAYITLLMKQNNRRPAFKDEVRQKFVVKLQQVRGAPESI